MSDSRIFIDASLFLGMHGSDEPTRIACKNFFVEHLHGVVTMSLEHVGRCDDMVWRYQRAVQDAYYPFMDNLHTDMKIPRRGYEAPDLHRALEAPELAAIPLFDRLLLAMVMNHDGVLYTASPHLWGRRGVPVQAPEVGRMESVFPEKLEALYGESLRLRFDGMLP